MENYILLYGDKKPEDNVCIINMFKNNKKINLGWTDFDYNKNIKTIEELINDGIKQVIFSGLEIGWDRLIKDIKGKYSDIKIKVICNTLDSLLYYDYERQNFFNLLELSKQNIIEDTCTSPFKGLLIQECQVAKKELKILSGENISKLFEEAQNDTEKFAVMKAYYNLSRKYFRENSDYFKNNQSADMYICLTAGQEINQMILDRKITREN